jgi:filamentous hemagglutinin
MAFFPISMCGRNYASHYAGELSKITVKRGTSLQLQEIGILANPGTSRYMPDLDFQSGAWGLDYARFKLEGGQISTQLDKDGGRALEIFNNNIVGFEVVGKPKVKKGL